MCNNGRGVRRRPTGIVGLTVSVRIFKIYEVLSS